MRFNIYLVLIFIPFKFQNLNIRKFRNHVNKGFHKNMIKNLSFNNLKIGISCIIFVIMFNHKRMEAIWQKYSRGKYLIHFGPEWSH